MKKDRKSIDKIEGNKIDTNQVHGGKMDVPDAMKEMHIEDMQDFHVKIKGYVRERGVKD